VPTSKIATSNSATVIASATRLNLMSRDHQRFEDHANGGFLADCTARLTVCNWPVSDNQTVARTPPMAGFGRPKNAQCKCCFSDGQRQSPWATVHPMPSMTGGARFGLSQYVGPVRPE